MVTNYTTGEVKKISNHQKVFCLEDDSTVALDCIMKRVLAIFQSG